MGMKRPGKGLHRRLWHAGCTFVTGSFCLEDRMDYLRHALLMIVAVFLVGCLESNPQPSPEQDSTPWSGADIPGASQKSSYEIDTDRILSSASGGDDNAVIVGISGAADGAEEMSFAADDAAERDGEGDAPHAAVDEDGSFAVVIPQPKPVIKLRFYYPDADAVDVEVELPVVSEGDDADGVWVWHSGRAGEQASGAPPEEPYNGFADLDGQEIAITVVVTGEDTIQVAGTVFSTTPLAQIVAVNLDNLDKAVDSASNTGEFALDLVGVQGDTISVFAVNPNDQSKATPPVNLVVP